MDEKKISIKLHVLHCGNIRVSEKVPYGGGVSLKNAARSVLERDEKRVVLPVSAYLIEHPQGRVLVDTGWSRSISPNGVYDAEAVRAQMPSYLADFYRPWVEKGQTVTEQLDALGIKPEELDTVLITHLDADHISGLHSVAGAKRLLMAEEEKWWSCRTVYKCRQPKAMWFDLMPDTFWYKGTMEGPLWWSYDLFGDETVTLICLPGHTDGIFAIRIKNGGRFVLLCSDAAFGRKNWEDGILPGFGFNNKAAMKSLKWIKEESKKPGCLGVFANHDPEVRPQVIEL